MIWSGSNEFAVKLFGISLFWRSKLNSSCDWKIEEETGWGILAVSDMLVCYLSFFCSVLE